LGQDLNITMIVPSLSYPTDQTLFVATNKGIFHSTDAGSTWAPLGQALQERAIVALLQDRRQDRPGVVTLGGAIWRLG
jgi:ligand-binding sensor domain-containing protein